MEVNMQEATQLDGLPNLPQTRFLHQLVPALWPRPDVVGLWLEGSMGRDNADLYSDVDLHIGVEPATLDQWRALAVQDLFGEAYAAHFFSHFAEDFFVYHVYLKAGGIYDVHLQPISRVLHKTPRLILACRDEAYRNALLAATPTAADEAALLFAPQPLDPALLPPLLTSFWINADKGRKVIYRNQELTIYTGLHLFRQMLARLLFMEQTGTDCGDLTSVSIHRLKAAALVLGQTWGDDLLRLLGAPARTRLEIWQAQEQLHQAFARVGRLLAARYEIVYPEALEEIVRENWQLFKAEAVAPRP